MQVLKHRTHYVCLVAHVRYLNSKLNGATLTAVALSLVPSAHAISSDRLGVLKLSQFLSWFRSIFKVSADAPGKDKDDFPRPLGRHLVSLFQKTAVRSNEELVLLFIALCRSQGWKTRLVVNLATVPPKLNGKKADTKVMEEPPRTEEEATAKGKSKTKKEEAKKCSKGKKESPKASGESDQDQGPSRDRSKTPSKKRRSTGSPASRGEKKKAKSETQSSSVKASSTKRVPKRRSARLSLSAKALEEAASRSTCNRRSKYKEPDSDDDFLPEKKAKPRGRRRTAEPEQAPSRSPSTSSKKKVRSVVQAILSR